MQARRRGYKEESLFSTAMKSLGEFWPAGVQLEWKLLKRAAYHEFLFSRSHVCDTKEHGSFICYLVPGKGELRRVLRQTKTNSQVVLRITCRWLR